MKPTIKVYVGRPVTGAEADSVRRLHAGLLKRGVDALLLINFTAKDRQIDCVAVTAKQTALLDFKEITGPVRGGLNGFWFIRSHGGTEVRYPGENPYVEVSTAKYALSDELAAFRQRSNNVPPPRKGHFYKQLNSAVCLCPEIAPGSNLPPGDFKCWIWSFSTAVEEICTTDIQSSWGLHHWERFATEHLGLEEISLEGATDPECRKAELMLAMYRQDLTGLLSHGLPPQLPGLPEELPHGEHFVLVGPSGIGKTVRVQHHALKLREHGLVLFVEAMHYTGEFRALLQKGVSPLFAGRVEELSKAAATCGFPIHLIVDGFDKCRESLRAYLVRDIAAFCKWSDCRVVVTSQFDPSLPPAIKCKTVQMQHLTNDQKISVFRFHAGDSVISDKSQLEPFETSHDLMVAGQCRAQLASSVTRAELYDAYVTQCLPRNKETVAAALCRHLAASLARSLSSELSISEFEQEAEEFLRKAGTPLVLADELRQSKLVKVGPAGFSFSHQQIQDHFYADWLCRNTNDFDTLTLELCKPLHRSLAETIISRQKSAERVSTMLRDLCSVITCHKALLGQLGELAKQVIKRDVHSLVSDAMANLANVTVDLKIAEKDSKKAYTDWPELVGFRQWSRYETCLAQLIGTSLMDPEIRDRAVELFLLTAVALQAAADREAQRIGLKSASEFSRVLHIILALHKLDMQCPASEIYHSWRSSLMFGQLETTAEDQWIAALRTHLDGASPGASAFILYALCEFYDKYDSPPDDLAQMFARAWNTRLRSVRIEALQMLQRFAARVLSGSSEQLDRVRDMLEQVKEHVQGKDLILNSNILETLTAYEMLPQPVEPEQALQQMRGVIDPSSDYARMIMEIWTTFAHSESLDPLAEEANRLLGMFFEEVLQDVYYQAFQQLSEPDQVSFMNLAAHAREPFGDLAFVLRGLVGVCSPSSADVFHRYSEKVLFDSWIMDQEKTEVFLLAVIGCAKLGLDLPVWQGGDDTASKAWCIVREIVFHHVKRARATTMNALWQSLQAEAALGAADVLFMMQRAFGVSAVHQTQFSVNLLEEYPQQVKEILEYSLQNRDKLTSASKFGASDHHTSDRTNFMIGILGKLGDASTLEFLIPLVDDMVFGGSALSSFKTIKLRLAIGSAHSKLENE